jgi:hypothetical protein
MGKLAPEFTNRVQREPIGVVERVGEVGEVLFGVFRSANQSTLNTPLANNATARGGVKPGRGRGGR